MNLTIEQSSEFCNISNKCDENLPLLVMSFTEGPLTIMCLLKRDAVESWKRLMGPENSNEARIKYPATLRARYGESKKSFCNILYGSKNVPNAVNEIRFFFPNWIVSPISDGFTINRYLQTYIYDLLFNGLQKCEKVRPDDPITWIAKWLLENNPNKPIFSTANEKSANKSLQFDSRDRSSEDRTYSSGYSRSSGRWDSTTSSDITQTNTTDSRSSNTIMKNIICPNCQKLVKLIYSPKVMESSVTLETMDIPDIENKIGIKCKKHSLINDLSLESPSGTTKFTSGNETSTINSPKCDSCVGKLADSQTAKCTSCNEVFRMDLLCLDKLASNLNLKMGCRK